MSVELRETVKLRDYQEETVKKVFELYVQNPHGKAKFVWATGLGKTIGFSALAHKIREYSNTNVLILAHRDELLNQAIQKYRRIDPSAIIGKICGDTKEWGAPVTVASVQTLMRPNALKQLPLFNYGLVIVDECFPAGTLIDGRPIETIKAGDMVTAFDESTQTFTQKKVVRTFRNPAPGMLLKITSGSQTVVCTPNHPFYTSSGWKPAGQLTTGDLILHERDNGALHHMQQDIFSVKVPNNQMETWSNHSLQQQRVQSKTFLSNGSQNQPKVRQYANENQQSYEQAWCKGKSTDIAQSDRAQAAEPGWQWQRSNDSTTNTGRSIGLANGVCGENRSTTQTRLSNLLQDRHSQSNNDDSNRSGRSVTHVTNQESTGPEENGFSCWARVDCIEIYQPGSNGTFGKLCPDGYVYNFEVEDLHTYIANGFVVHNCHHAHKSNGYGKIWNVLPGAFWVGVTATDIRLDKRTNNDMFGEAICRYEIPWAIPRGHLCDLRAIAIKTGTTLSDLKTSTNEDGEKDYQIGELDRAINTESRNRRVVQAYLEHAKGRPFICFGVTVKHAEALTKAFQEAGIKAFCITGETPHEERQRLYTALENGLIDGLCSINVLTEGFDCERLSCVIMARPTQSQCLFIQCIGRGLRLYPDKKDCLVLDLTDNVFNHRLEPVSLRKVLKKHLKDGESFLEMEAREEEERKERKERAEKEVQVRKLHASREEDQIVDLLETFHWQEKPDGKFVLEVGAAKHRLALVPDEEEEDTYTVWARLSPFFEGQCWLQTPMELEYALQFAERKARMLLADPKSVGLLDRTAPWRSKPIDPESAQVKKLNFHKIPWHAGMTKGEAADLIDAHLQKIEQEKAAKEAKRRERIGA